MSWPAMLLAPLGAQAGFSTTAVKLTEFWLPRTYREGMQFPRIGARKISLALCATIAVMSLSAVAANAQDNGPTDPGVRCAAKVGPGQYEFYLPGERATDVNGNKWVCGADGQWFRDYSSLVIKGTTAVNTSLTSSTTATLLPSR